MPLLPEIQDSLWREVGIDGLATGSPARLLPSQIAGFTPEFRKTNLPGPQQPVIQTAVPPFTQPTLPPGDEIFRRLCSLGLRPSEVKAARCLLNGWCNKRIANELGLSAGTVRNHLSVVMRLLNVSNRTQASLQIQSFLIR